LGSAARTSLLSTIFASTEPDQPVSELQEQPSQESPKSLLDDRSLWLLILSSYGLAATWLWIVMFELYFRDNGKCSILDELNPAAERVESVIGGVPGLLRSTFIGILVWNVGRRITGFKSEDAHLVAELAVGRGATVGQLIPLVGWDAIVGGRSQNTSV
jgi:hypothetical protein